MRSGEDFRSNARKLLFNSGLKDFPVMFEMYMRTFNITKPIDECMAEIIELVRTSADRDLAYSRLCDFLDGIEGPNSYTVGPNG